jgi:NAD(P)-dependent dehydrogenase (short-subunit alcohol dehydrogenase family)
MDIDLTNKLVVITGGANGIGKAIDDELSLNRASVISLDLEKGFDLEDPKHLKSAKFLAKLSDILINNVGGCGTWKPEEAKRIMNRNYHIAQELTRAFLSRKKKGRVIFISSIYGKEKGPNPEFTAAKSALIAFSKSLAGNHKGITFNVICPGHIDVGKKFPYKPKIIGKPEDVSKLALFLCSDYADHINGACITVDGGESHSF